MHELQRSMRSQMEQRALHWARREQELRHERSGRAGLSVLLETADMLLPRTIRWTELAESVSDVVSHQALAEALRG